MTITSPLVFGIASKRCQRFALGSEESISVEIKGPGIRVVVEMVGGYAPAFRLGLAAKYIYFPDTNARPPLGGIASKRMQSLTIGLGEWIVAVVPDFLHDSCGEMKCGYDLKICLEVPAKVNYFPR